MRSVNFEEAVWSHAGKNRTAEFADALLRTVENHSADVSNELRVIVRCETEQEVRDVVTELARRKQTVIGIHERFKRADGSLFRKRVPDPADEPAQYWVHQWKMLEGLDDARFRLLAIYSRFLNARNLVQQVGRVIRNPDRQRNQHAWVLVHRDHGQLRLWENFLGYEGEVRTRKDSGKSELTIFDDFVQTHLTTPRFYLLGDFRRGLNSNDISDPRQYIQMRKSVLVLKPRRRFNWNNCIDSVEKELLGENAIPFGSPHRTGDTFLQLYQLLEQSPVVTEAFMDVGLGYVFVGVRERLVFYSDSGGRRLEYLTKHADSLDPEILQRLFPDTHTEIGEVSLISGDFGNHVFRRRTLSTKSLDLVPPSLSDYVQVCSTATGRVDEDQSGQSELIRRYVGFTRGRLTERTAPVANFADFDVWLNEIAKKLKRSSVSGTEALLRFALPTTFSTTATDEHILFDVVSEEIDHSAFSPAISGVAEDKLWRVTAGRFVGEIDEKQFEATLRYDEKRNRYRIDSRDLEKITIHEPDRPARPLNRYLNEVQSFRILRSDNSFYTEGKFFKPNALPWRGGGSRLNIVTSVIACGALQGATSEKGDLTGWGSGSVFGAIANPRDVLAAASLKPDTVVCYDVTKPTEIADFFAVSYADHRIAMIHAKKARGGSKMSASAFYDLCSQAVRYLGFFNPNDSRSRITAAQLDQMWSPDAAKYSPRNRVVINNSRLRTTAEIARRFEEAVRDPTFIREVWMVMGNGLSRAAFEKAMKKGNPLANERELALLFQATWSSVAAAGATLRVICPP